MKIRVLTRAPIQTALTRSDIDVLRAQHLDLLRATSLAAPVERFKAQSTGDPGALSYLRTRTHGPTAPQRGLAFTDNDHNVPLFTNYYKNAFRQERTIHNPTTIASFLQDVPSLSDEEKKLFLQDVNIEELESTSRN